ncbi:MAG TPA: YjgP/YjgQ family permease [Candidatus Marinimicrobia bacterium]|nr:YjgP/YjgQ family permease [Candidatus Neomarinimicrobiota bacterium]
MIKQVDCFLLKKFFFNIFAALIVFVAIFLIVDIVEHIDNFIDNGLNLTGVLLYYLYTMPWFIHIALPMSSLLAVVFLFGMMNRRAELTALKSSGISLYRIAMPFLICGLLISFGAFQFEDKVVVPANRELNAFKIEFLNKRKRPSPTIKRNLYLQADSNAVLYISVYSTNTEKGEGVSLHILTDGIITERLDAEVLFRENDEWKLSGIEHRKFSDTGEIYSQLDTMAFNWQLSKEDLARDQISPNEMNYRQLKEFIVQTERHGLITTRWQVKLHFKTAMNFTVFIVILFGISLSARQKRGGGLASGVGISLLVILIYTASLKFGETMGYNGIMEPFCSVWIPNAVFLFSGIILMIQAPK